MPIFTYAKIGMRKTTNVILETAKIIKTIGHPMRIEILQLLSDQKKNKMSVKEIHQHLGLNQPETSKHLILMKRQSILKCEKKESYSYYKLNTEKFPFIQNIVNYLKQKQIT